jgi:enolase
MHKEKPSNGRKYFLFGSSILQNGIKKIKTMAILIAPNKIGGIEALRPSFAVG